MARSILTLLGSISAKNPMYEGSYIYQTFWGVIKGITACVPITCVQTHHLWSNLYFQRDFPWTLRFISLCSQMISVPTPSNKNKQNIVRKWNFLWRNVKILCHWSPCPKVWLILTESIILLLVSAPLKSLWNISHGTLVFPIHNNSSIS